MNTERLLSKIILVIIIFIGIEVHLVTAEESPLQKASTYSLSYGAKIEKGDKRRYLYESYDYSSSFFSTSSSSAKTLITIIVDSIVKINSDTTIAYVTRIDSSLNSVTETDTSFKSDSGWFSYAISHVPIVICKTTYDGYDGTNAASRFPTGIFERIEKTSIDSLPAPDTIYEKKGAFQYGSYCLFADSIGLVSAHYSEGWGMTGHEYSYNYTYHIIDDTTNLKSLVSIIYVKNSVKVLKSKATYQRIIGSGSHPNAFTLNGRKGTWKSGAMTMLIQKKVYDGKK